METFKTGNKNALSSLLGYISTRDFFKNTREVLKKHEPQVNASRTSRALKKTPKFLYNSIMYEENVFHFFYKCIVNCARSY